MKTSIFYNTDEVTKLIDNALANEIKNCPWCGKQPFIHLMYVDTLNEQWVVSCENELCLCQPTIENVYYTKEEAIEAWNAENDGTTSQCPFCGTPFDESCVSTVWIEVDYVAGYNCPGCYCQMIGNGRLTKEEAIAALKMRWNRRC